MGKLLKKKELAARYFDSHSSNDSPLKGQKHREFTGNSINVTIKNFSELQRRKKKDKKKELCGFEGDNKLRNLVSEIRMMIMRLLENII